MLIASKRFLPLFITQFFGSFNDNFLKNALVIMVAYRLTKSSSEIASISNWAAALFILPYFLFSCIAGQLADKYDKSRYTQVVKLCEIILMIAACIGFVLHSTLLLLAVLACMGTQSTFFGPAKYSLLPSLLSEQELLRGNAWIEGGTYLSILAGTIAGSLLICVDGGEWFSGLLLISLAIVGYLASRAIPSVPSVMPDLKPDWNLIRQTWRILADDIFRNRIIRDCVLSVSVFWMAGVIYVAQTPVITQNAIGGNEKICTILFVVFTLGVAAGAAFAGRLFRNNPAFMDWRLIPIILLMGLVTWDLAWISCGVPRTELVSVGAVFHDPQFYRLAFDYFLIAACGGCWAVPLQTRMQSEAPKEQLARVIAGNNIANAFAMAFGSILAVVLIQFHCSIGTIFILLGLGILAAGIGTIPLARTKASEKNN